MIKKNYCSILFQLAICLFPLTICEAQSVYAKSEDSTFSVDSKILMEKCKVFVNLPENYKTTTEKYPVIYVLDGEYYFSLASETANLLNQAQKMPSCIIIGIVSNNRQRDFTTLVDTSSGQTQDIKTSGGADKFLDYLEKELVPTVEKNYRTQPNRVIIGHSIGGLLAYYALITKPNLFQNYISIDGSLWWNKGVVGKSVIDYLSNHPDFKGKIFECRKDISIPVRFPVNVELLNYLDKNRPKGLEYTYLELKNENHATIVIPGIYYGLTGIFSNYK